MKKRRYRQKHRAEQQLATRERIVDAAIALHGQVGPADTTISAIAERAGVQRLTVYRHFPDDRALFGACSSKWFRLHPPPDLMSLGAGSPMERTEALLTALYGYYRQNEQMWTSVYRDADRVPIVAEVIQGFHDYLSAAAENLADAWGSKQARVLRLTLAHVLRFSTWQSLTQLSGSADELPKTAMRWVLGASDGL